jgi:hypothetical protein
MRAPPESGMLCPRSSGIYFAPFGLHAKDEAQAGSRSGMSEWASRPLLTRGLADIALFG